MADIFRRTWASFYGSLNFFRLHVIFFTLIPLISAAIFYAANGLYPVSFIDALFNCISAMTVTGLATVDLSQLTGFQQAILFVIMCIGNPVIVSWLMVYIRRRFFRKRLSHIIAEELKRERQGGIIAVMRERTSISRSLSRGAAEDPMHPSPTGTHGKHSRPGFLGRLTNRLFPAASPDRSPTSTVSGAATPSSDKAKRKSGLAQRLRPDMIRRTEAEPQRVDPMGGVGGLMVDEIGGKGKGREFGGQQYTEKVDQFHNGEEVHHVATGSSGSQTRYDGASSPNPSFHRTDSRRSAEAEGVADDDTSGGQTLAVFRRYSNGTIPTPHRPEYDIAPHSSYLSPSVPDQLNPAPLMESPRETDDQNGILLHSDTDRDLDTTIDDDPGALGRPTSDDGYPASRSRSRGHSAADAEEPNSRNGISSSPVRFKPPPIRVTPGTMGGERLSPNRTREADHISVPFSGHERQASEAITLREPGAGELPRTQTIEFANPPQVRGRAGTRRQSAGVNSERERARFRSFSLGGSSNIAPANSDAGDTSSANIGAGTSSIGHGYTSGRGRASSTGRQRMGSVSTAYFPRTATGRSYATTRMSVPAQVPSNQSGYGGFPMPHELAGRVIKRFFPQTMTLTRTLTMGSGGAEPREVPYITFDAIVGRNSQFRDLSQEEQDELGGVEYRALGALLWIIAAYYFGIQLFAFVVFAPYSSMSKWAPVFREQQHRFVPPAWFSAFQVVSAFTNTGLSLVDQSMIPFQTAYPMVIILFFLILAGNTAFPIFLRFFIWLLSKVVGQRSHETLSFLLDHPRRCYTLLFPSHQTWLLFIVLLGMIITDWVSFIVLDIGNDVIEAIPVGTRIAIGLLQAGAVRSAGFAVVSISALAPAVKVLYVIMMYIAVYPIALSVRATNVYEEQSLGIDDERRDEEEPSRPSDVHAWGSYLAWHARKQLSFDMWWLAVALWLVCIIERSKIMNPESADLFDIFTIIFELVSAYGNVGLSFGLPTVNYSFSGALRPLSKLIICIVMLRGRHRGLPHAIDRAVMLPWELMGHQGQNRGYNSFDASSNRQSMGGEPGPSLEAHSTGRAPAATHGIDLKHRTNTILSPVHEVLTPVTSVVGTPRATFSALGDN